MCVFMFFEVFHDGGPDPGPVDSRLKPPEGFTNPALPDSGAASCVLGRLHPESLRAARLEHVQGSTEIYTDKDSGRMISDWLN